MVYGFIIYSSVGPIAYTKHFCILDPLSHKTEEFLSEIKMNKTIITKENLTIYEKDLINAGVKSLICEGTKIHKEVIE